MDALIGALKSKTVWFNVTAGVVGVVTQVLADVGLPAELYALIVAGGNVVLRAVTTEPLSSK